MNIADVGSALGGGVAARQGAKRIGIRPEHIEIGESGILTTITVKEQLGGESYLYTRTEDGTDVVVKTDGDDQHKPGDAVHLHLPEHRVHQFGADGATLGDAV